MDKMREIDLRSFSHVKEGTISVSVKRENAIIIGTRNLKKKKLEIA